MSVEPKRYCEPITFANLEKFVGDAELPATAVNDGEEDIIISKESSEIKPGYCYRLDTYQKNGWIRTNRYYGDNSMDETFEEGGPR